MKKVSSKTICPLPWVHFSAHLDTTMRLCCNTGGLGFVLDDQGQPLKLKDIESIDQYFNLDFYKKIRNEMMNDEKPNICSKCYEVEDSGGFSVRQGYLSLYESNEDFLNQVANTKPDGETETCVKSLDFSLSNKCNLKCVMCSPDASFLLKKDFDTLGIPYDSKFTEGANKNWNSFDDVERLMPALSENLSEYLTTGGEPFLNKTHFKSLELIVEQGRAGQVALNYHTNCTVENQKLWELWNNFKAVNAHLSIDAYSSLDEYIRQGTSWEKLESIVDKLLAHPKVNAEVHTCVQALNIFNLTDLYEWIAQKPDIPKLPFHIWMHSPRWLHINILPQRLKELAFIKLDSYFKKQSYQDETLVLKKNQILSYLRRSLNEDHDLEQLEVFKERIKKLEEMRGLTPIENLVPELKSLFPTKKRFFFF